MGRRTERLRLAAASRNGNTRPPPSGYGPETHQFGLQRAIHLGPFTVGRSQWAVHSGPFTVGRSDPGLEGRDDFVILWKTTGFVFGVHEVAVNDDVEYPLLALDQLGLD